MLDLLKDPFPHFSRPLKGHPYYRLAVGESRIIYQADDELVSVAAIGKRNDAAVYRTLNR